jgi:uncharacterized protein YjbI with pentapeptide repeats
MQARVGLIAVAVLAVLAAATAFAANRKDIARAKNTHQIAECVRCDLSGADMRHGFFQLANMIEANLANAQFDGANMAGVQLMNANLSHGSFTFTNFSGAQFQGADMRGADFSNAWFNWSWLAGAKLEGANFTNVHMIGAQLQGADMSKVIGLTQGQLRFACGDVETKLPPGIETPRCPY